MEKKNLLLLASWILILLGLVMVYLGFRAPQVLLPPVVTGIGFFAIAWAFMVIRK